MRTQEEENISTTLALLFAIWYYEFTLGAVELRCARG
jgi:hypothetical protein